MIVLSFSDYLNIKTENPKAASSAATNYWACVQMYNVWFVCALWATWKHGVRLWSCRTGFPVVSDTLRRTLKDWGQSSWCNLCSTYTAASRLGSPGSWCRAAGPAEVQTPGRSPAAAACWRLRTRTSWPSTSAAGAPSADATWCPGTGSWCTCRRLITMSIEMIVKAPRWWQLQCWLYHVYVKESSVCSWE